MNQDIKPTSPSKKKESANEVKVPWWFNLHLKDIIKPITIKRIQLFYAGVILLGVIGGSYYVWENYLREPSGAEFVDEIVASAGGMDAWKNLRSGEFTRTHNLYAEDGTMLRTINETFFFKKTNKGVKLQIKSVGEDGSVVWVGNDVDGYWATRDGIVSDPKDTAQEEGMMCDSKFCAPLCASSMAFYRFSMPFKLKDPGINASLAATDLNIMELKLMGNSGQEASVLDISFDENIGRDRWRFYVDPSDKLIHKMEYFNKSDKGDTRPEEIYWTDHKTAHGITFSHRWTRYWPNGKVMDEYIYSDVDFETEIADSFFNRPDDGELALNK